jgi:hypothetical protein
MPRWTVVLFFVSLMLLWVSASAVQALTISGVTINVAGTNTGDNAVNGGTGSNNTSATSIVTPGGTVGDAETASVSAQTRYASNLWADGDTFSEVNAITTNSYEMSLSVSADPGTVYDITIDSLFQGILTRVDDSFCCDSQANVSAVEVTINSVVSVAHATSAQLLALDFYDETHSFFEAGTDTLTGRTGTTVLNFAVIWTSNADNTNGDESGVLIGMDEAGGPVGGVSAGEYGNLSALPPFAARDLNEDGHFLTVSATVTSVIPEPVTAVLLGMGLVGLAAHRRRS